VQTQEFQVQNAAAAEQVLGMARGRVLSESERKCPEIGERQTSPLFRQPEQARERANALVKAECDVLTSEPRRQANIRLQGEKDTDCITAQI